MLRPNRLSSFVGGRLFYTAGICKAEGKVVVIDGRSGKTRTSIDCPTDQVPTLIPRYRYAGQIFALSELF